MNIERFIQTRQALWRDLDRKLDSAEKAGDKITQREVHEIVRLYRQSCSDLNLARSYTANPELLERLNHVTGRAYRFIYRGARGEKFGPAAKRLLLSEIPATFRREQRVVLAAMLSMLLGAAIGALAVLIDPANDRRLIPGQFFTESVSDRVEQIESSDERIDSVGDAAAFGAYLYTHNIRVSLLAFSLGAITILFAYWILFYNGVILGAVAMTYILAGHAAFFFAWVGPHGALELPAIVFGGAAGLKLGEAFWMPGQLSRAAAVRRAFPAVWRMLVATALTLILAGIVEGSFSQFSSKTFPYPLKISVAAMLLAGLIIYLFVRRSEESSS